MKQIKLSDKIYEKNFEIKPYGYSCQEVDAFFDELNEDIAALERSIEDSKDKIVRLEMEKKGLEKENRKLSIANLEKNAQNQVENKTTANFNNIDILERLSNLESMVKAICDKFNVNNKS